MMEQNALGNSIQNVCHSPEPIQWSPEYTFIFLEMNFIVNCLPRHLVWSECQRNY